jgi:hypothetical protein
MCCDQAVSPSISFQKKDGLFSLLDGNNQQRQTTLFFVIAATSAPFCDVGRKSFL